MGDENQEENKNNNSLKMIPVLTVIKNGAILKNIFIVNNKSEPHDEETEEILIVGRHPDCNIVLLHPSISRFHFQIYSKPSSRQLFVTDLSSVHGTWVSGKKVKPKSRVELKEDDTITVGSSTRVYRLHWILFSRAYDTFNPFVSLSDLDLLKEKQEASGDNSVECENQDDVESNSDTRVIFPTLQLMAGEFSTPDKKNHTPNSVLLNSFENKGQLKDFKSPGTSQSSSKNTSSLSIEQNVGAIFSSDEEDLSSKFLEQSKTARSSKHQTNGDISVECETRNDVESNSDTRELMAGEFFTPDKQNHAPNSVLLNSFETKGQLQEFKSPRTIKSSSRNTSGPSIEQNVGMIFSSDEEDQSSKFLKQSKTARSFGHQIDLDDDIVLEERRAESILLQSFSLEDGMFSLGMSLSDASLSDAAASSMDSINCTEKKPTNATSVTTPGDKRRWTMIADTTSLLEKESRKYLQLLEGLKGTHLVIPNMVINELHALKQHGSLSRKTKEADLALQWIEECVVNTKRWIHVQRSEETLSSIAPTPPASPVSKFHEGSWQLPFGNSFEIISPSTEDHILDSALFCKEMISDGKPIILSNNAALMIKAMAEGLICETAKDFRQSLVNPFSKRFLWAGSTPRGRTWTVFDDLVMKDKYYRSPTKKVSKVGSAKGLKLLQLYNSRSGQLVKVM